MATEPNPVVITRVPLEGLTVAKLRWFVDQSNSSPLGEDELNVEPFWDDETDPHGSPDGLEIRMEMLDL